jgi:undecaprenyl-diphosphatase
MSVFDALILGLTQGLTEFFPVSSSTHLKIAKLLLGVDETQNMVLFDLTCHSGTLIAVFIFLRKEILYLFQKEQKKVLFLFTALVPLAPFYFLLKPLREYASQTHLLGFFLLVTSLILFVGQHLQVKRKQEGSEIKDALWIGVSQASALIPGISRSASTISCARILGWQAKEAVEFSFFLSIPTILGGNCLELLRIFLSSSTVSYPSLGCSLAGFLSSAGVGLIVIRYAMRILTSGKLSVFGWYCLIFGFLLIITLNL